MSVFSHNVSNGSKGHFTDRLPLYKDMNRLNYRRFFKKNEKNGQKGSKVGQKGSKVGQKGSKVADRPPLYKDMNKLNYRRFFKKNEKNDQKQVFNTCF